MQTPDPIADTLPDPAADQPNQHTTATKAPTAQVVELLWVGSVGGMEQGLVERAGIAYRAIDTGQLSGINPLKALANLGKMAKGVRQSLAILREFRPDVCLVTGGYVCAPVVIACRLRRIPVLIYLPDMTPGSAILWLSRLVQRVAVSFPEAARYFGGLAPKGKAVVTGYPVRQELVKAATDRALAREQLARNIDRPAMDGSDGLPLVLIWGGSSGARSINLATWASLADLLPHAHVLHVVGQRDWGMAKEQMQTLRTTGVLNGGSVRRYHPVDYLHESMTLALAAADLTVARAGASTLGEFPVAALPSILVPLTAVKQQGNAELLANHGAAIIIPDERLAEDLGRSVVELLNQPERRLAMGKAATALAKPNAAQNIADTMRDMIINSTTTSGKAK